MPRAESQRKSVQDNEGHNVLPRVSLRVSALALVLALAITAPNSPADHGAHDSSVPDEHSLLQAKSRVHSSNRVAVEADVSILKSLDGSILNFNWWTTQSADTDNPWDYRLETSVLDKSLPRYAPHPLWKPEWHRMLDAGSLRAGAGLFAAGILCTAGGIGGGGIYVTVLMVFGALSVHDAIPMSKVVVFAASTPSLILNIAKSITLEEDEGGKTKTLIDYNLCRVVVPWALLGTLLGVFLNEHTPARVILGLLITILFFILVMICRTGWQQKCKEDEEEAVTECSNAANESRGGGGPPPPEQQFRKKCVGEEMSNSLTGWDIRIGLAMLLTIIYCGPVRFHGQACMLDTAPLASYGDACHHPIAMAITFGQMANMKSAGILEYVTAGIMAWPIGLCTCMGIYYSSKVIANGEVWGSMHKLPSIGESCPWGVMAFYAVMSVTTGCLAGLVGIGGGLIFSPVFIQMGVDPHIAVASSATCVIFTSSSTTFQYLLTDRIIVALIFSFGIPHLAASYSGTKIVHYLQDNYGAKKSWITWIVAAGVFISAILTIHKFVHATGTD